MKSFAEYVKFRESLDSSDQEIPSSSDMNQTSAVERMARIAWKKHNQDIRSFFEKLSSKDPEIAAEYERIEKIKAPTAYNSDNPFGEKDVVRVSTADNGLGQELTDNY